MLGTSAFLPSKPHNAPLTASGDRARSHNVDPPRVVRQQGRRAITPTILRRVHGHCFLDGVTPTSQRHGTTPHVGRKSIKELQSLASLFTHSFITSESMHFSQKCHDADSQARLYHGTQGLPELG
jgi:hypothetical protein